MYYNIKCIFTAIVIAVIIIFIYVLRTRLYIKLYGLSYKPEFYNIDWFADMKEFQENFKVIKQECEGVPMKHNDIHRRQNLWTATGDQFVLDNIDVEGWIYAWQAESYNANQKWINYPLMFKGLEFKNNLKHCPKLHEILLKHKDIINIAGLSLMKPYSQIKPHQDTTGPSYGTLGYHLGIIIPNEELCTLTVNDIVKHQREGQSIVFDSTYLHSADNKTDKDRIILYIEFKI